MRSSCGAVVEKTATKIYDDQGRSPAERERLDGYRPNCLKASKKYKARPLEGMWATAPFLHNGSVPNLYELLQSKEGRSMEPFYLGSRVFDPKRVGYVPDKLAGGFELDPTIPGNLNTGHYIGKGTLKEGYVVSLEGDLAEEDRWALIEYLKHMGGLETLEN